MHVAGGEYLVQAPIVFEAQDGGWPGHPIRYVAWDPPLLPSYDGDPFVSGGARLTGWTDTTLRVPAPNPTDPQWAVWKCVVPQTIADDAPPRDLWVNNHRLIRSRFPDPPVLGLIGTPYTQTWCNSPSNWVANTTSNPPIPSYNNPPCGNLGFLVIESITEDPVNMTQDVVIKNGNGPDGLPTTYDISSLDNVDWKNVEVVAHALYTSPRQRPGVASFVNASTNSVFLRFPVTNWQNTAIPAGCPAGQPQPCHAEQDMGAWGVSDLSGFHQFAHSYLQLRPETNGVPDQVYFENDLEFLTQAYEWCYKPETRELYVALCVDPDTDGVNVVVPVAPKLLVLDRTSHISFEGIDFGYTYWEPELADGETFGYTTTQAGVQWMNGAKSYQVDTPITSAIELLGSSYCTFAACKIGHTGGGGVLVGTHDSGTNVYLASNFNLIDGCELFDLNGHGVWLGDQKAQIDNWDSLTDDYIAGDSNAVVHSLIHRYGVVYKDAVGVYISHSRLPMVENNEIAYGNWCGISAGTFQRQEWGDTAIACDFTWSPNNEGVSISNNHVHHTNLRMTDGGGIYVMGGHRYHGETPSAIHGNYVHDVIVNPYLNNQSHVKGLHFDSGSAGWVITGNYVANAYKLFQFNSGGTATVPDDVPFGTAAWPVSYDYSCTSGEPYQLLGMDWYGGPLGNLWLDPGPNGNGPYGPWEQCYGYGAMPTSQGENTRVTAGHPGIAPIVNAAGPNPAIPINGWTLGGQRIYRSSPVLNCGESTVDPPADPF